MRPLFTRLLAFAAITLAAPYTHAASTFAFHCPENIQGEQKKNKALSDFMDWAAHKYPNITIEQYSALRIEFLEKHKCAKTLALIKSNESQQKLNDRYQCQESGTSDFPVGHP